MVGLESGIQGAAVRIECLPPNRGAGVNAEAQLGQEPGR